MGPTFDSVDFRLIVEVHLESFVCVIFDLQYACHVALLLISKSAKTSLFRQSIESCGKKVPGDSLMSANSYSKRAASL